MPTVLIAGSAVQLAVRFAEGDVLTDEAASVLNTIWQNRLRARLRYLLDKGSLTPDELQAHATALAAEPLRPQLTTDDGLDDPALDEALAMARELIVGRMAAEGLPPPRGLDAHAKALVDNMPDLQEKARLRVEARLRAAQTALQELAQ